MSDAKGGQMSMEAMSTRDELKTEIKNLDKILGFKKEGSATEKHSKGTKGRPS